jgi:hypothetical protein
MELEEGRCPGARKRALAQGGRAHACAHPGCAHAPGASEYCALVGGGAGDADDSAGPASRGAERSSAKMALVKREEDERNLISLA